MRYKISDEFELKDVAKYIADLCGKYYLFVLEAEMGMGKTTLIKAVEKALEVEDLVNSPTYSIVNEYSSKSGRKIFHFDLYRLSEEELYDIGFEDYLQGDDLVFVEWPEIGKSFYPSKYVEVKISLDGEMRVYEISELSFKA